MLSIIYGDVKNSIYNTNVYFKNSYEPDRIFNASTCGDNCAKWILEIGRIKDVTINLRHMMSFGKDTKFEIKVQNGGETAHSMKELIPIANKYLNEMKQE